MDGVRLEHFIDLCLSASCCVDGVPSHDYFCSISATELFVCGIDSQRKPTFSLLTLLEERLLARF